MNDNRTEYWVTDGDLRLGRQTRGANSGHPYLTLPPARRFARRMSARIERRYNDLAARGVVVTWQPRRFYVAVMQDGKPVEVQ